jgi:pyrroloquinoline quinone biosynthesis protein E
MAAVMNSQISAATKIKSERLGKDSLRETAALHLASFNDAPYNSGLSFDAAFKDLKQKFENGFKEYCLVLRKNKRIIAYLITERRDDLIIFGPIGVKKGFRGKKIGLVLLSKVIHSLQHEGFSKFMLRIDKKADYLLEYYGEIGFEKSKETDRHYYLRLNEKKLFKYNDVRWRKEKHGGLMHYRNRYYYIDDDARLILALNAITKEYAWAAKSNNIEKFNLFLKNGQAEKMKNNEMRFPHKMRLEITNKCNNRCVWCYASNRYEKGDLSKEEFINVIKYLADNGVFEITFSGGEPTLNKALPELIKYANNLGLITHLITNGTLLSKDAVKKMERAGLKTVQISIEGIENQHNRITNNKCFKDCVNGIKNVVNSKISLATNTTISNLNKNNIHEILQMLHSVGVKKANFNYCVTDKADLKISKEELENVLEQISTFKKGDFKTNWLQPMELCYIDIYKYFSKASKCSACDTSITISANGDLRPCSFSDTIVGNIKKNNLEEVWTSNFFKKFRKKEIMKETCIDCTKLAKCGGGCKIELLKNYPQ